MKAHTRDQISCLKEIMKKNDGDDTLSKNEILALGKQGAEIERYPFSHPREQDEKDQKFDLFNIPRRLI
jgi:hypothetical protein